MLVAKTKLRRFSSKMGKNIFSEFEGWICQNTSDTLKTFLRSFYVLPSLYMELIN